MTTQVNTASLTSLNKSKSGRKPRVYDTPRGVFSGMDEAAKANGMSISTFQKRLKDTPECFYDVEKA